MVVGRLHFKILLFLLFAVGICSLGMAQDRLVKMINSNWLFFKGDTAQANLNTDWERVSVPHTWNAADTKDDQPGYYRGDGWYKKTIYVPQAWREKEVYLYFEGAGQVAEVFVNGQSVGRHIGGYTFFNFSINKYLHYGTQGNIANEILVKVNNSHNPPFLVPVIALAI